MGYNQDIEIRISKLISKWKNTEAKNMFCGVYKDFLILRLGEKRSKEALNSPFVRPFDITGRPMKGWVMVERQGIERDKELEEWLKKARDFANTLPGKKTRET